MNSYNIKYYGAFWKNGGGELFYPSGEVLKLVLNNISEVGLSDCHFIWVSPRKCFSTVKGERIYLILGLHDYESSSVACLHFLYFKLFKDLQAALYSSVGFSYNLLSLCQWIQASISILFFKGLTKISVVWQCIRIWPPKKVYLLWQSLVSEP